MSNTKAGSSMERGQSNSGDREDECDVNEEERSKSGWRTVEGLGTKAMGRTLNRDESGHKGQWNTTYRRVYVSPRSIFYCLKRY